MPEHEQLDSAAKGLQQRVVFLQRRALALDICLAGVLVSLITTVTVTLGGWSWSPWALYGGIVLLAVLVFAVLAWRVRVLALPVLQRADRTLRLQERLSTAYEYLEQGTQSVFLPGLLTEAERVAAQVEPHRVFPGRWPRRVWGIPILLAALIGFTQLDVAPLQFQDMGREEVAQEVTREGERLERWGRRLEDLAKQQRLDRSLILARHMQNLGRRLQREGTEKSQIAQRISTLSQYLRRMQQELQERALMTEVGGMSARDVLMSGKSVKQELQDILQMLQNDALPREMAAVAEQGILRLSQQFGENTALEQLVQNLRAGNVQAARQLLQDILERQQAAEEMEHLERARRALEYSSRAIQRDGQSDQAPEKGAPQPGNQMAQQGPFSYDEEMSSEDMPSIEDFGAPGFDEGFGVGRHTRQGQEQVLRESDQPLSQVPVKSGEGSMRLAYVRYLPVQNEAREPLEQVVVRYQRTAEEVLHQEKIPRAYREQIKQYFLAIGMMSDGK